MTNTRFASPIERIDYGGWRILWDGYNYFYGRHGTSALSEGITNVSWESVFSRLPKWLSFKSPAWLKTAQLQQAMSG